MMSTCTLPMRLFNDSAARINIFRISSLTGTELLDAYIGLMVTGKLQTELTILSFLLKGRICPSDLWEIVGERIIEDRQETIWQEHQSNCVGGSKEKEHVIVEHFLMEERKKRGQMEVSLYSQALEHLQQHQISIPHSSCLFKWDARSPSGHTVACAPSACPTAAQEKCEAWLKRQHTYSSNLRSISSLPGLTAVHEAKRTPVTLSCMDATLPLLSTWVTPDVQKAFYDAFHAEQACQAELVTHSLAINGDCVYQRNIGLELLILQARMRRARAEIELYTMAIENARQLDFSDDTSTSSSSGFIPRPRPHEWPCYYEDRDDMTDDFDDFEFE